MIFVYCAMWVLHSSEQQVVAYPNDARTTIGLLCGKAMPEPVDTSWRVTDRPAGGKDPDAGRSCAPAPTDARSSVQTSTLHARPTADPAPRLDPGVIAGMREGERQTPKLTGSANG